jgi:GDSL-like lipase/acylhydrolase family protein
VRQCRTVRATVLLLTALAAACVADTGPARDADASLAGDAAADATTSCDARCDDAGEPPPPEGPARYSADRTLSPITPHVAARLRAALGPGLAEDVFAKAGDSITADPSFLRCFAGDAVDLGGRDELVPTLEHFLAGDAAGTTPFERESLAAGVGWSASAVLGEPSLLDEELDAIEPAFAIVMFGTNDVGFREAASYGADMLAIVDRLLARGTIPLLSSIPPRDDDPTVDARVPLWNAIVRGVAQGRQVPFLDLERELRALPGHGIGGDGVHLDASPRGACDLTSDGLAYGYDLRNLLSLETLDRVRAVVLDGAAAPDPPAALVPGDGTSVSPIPLDASPWSDLRSTEDAPQSTLARYDGCAAAQDESGPEVVYALSLDEAVTLHAVVVDGPDVDVDLHLLGGAVREDACLARDDREIAVDLDPGTYFLVLDTFVPADGRPRAGEFLVVVTLASP